MARTPESRDTSGGGPFAWMVRHRVAPNLLMIVMIAGGLLMSQTIKQEVFPEFSLDIVTVNVAYPGAAPEEVERSVVRPIEEAVRGLAGVKEVQSTSRESSGNVRIELETGAERQAMFQEIQQAVSRLRTLPDDAEEPQVSLQAQQRDVMELLIYGDVDEKVLRESAEFVRDELLLDDGITQVELQGARRVEIHVDVPQEQLRAHNLTLPEIANIVRSSALDTAGGSVKTEGGEIMLRVQERRNLAREFENIPIIAGPAGSVLRLRDIAEVTEGFEDSDVEATYNGKPAMGIEVFRVGEQTPIGVAQAVRDRLPEIVSSLPPSVDYVIQDDNSQIYSQRMSLLLKNGFLGLCLVLLLLSLFLEFKLAFWVTVGIPTAFLGTFLFLPFMDVSINIVSLFAFIIALGLVVDDAIIAGENIYEYRQRGMDNIQAAILGAKDIAVPISFSVLTNILAFMPIAFVPGTFGNIFGVIPFVAGTAFALSWVEALLVLPGHLGHTRENSSSGWIRGFHNLQQRFSTAFSGFIQNYYAPFLARAMRMRYVTFAGLFGILLIVLAVPMSNRMGFILMPEMESDTAQASATLSSGSPLSQAQKVSERMVESAQQVIAENGGDQLSRGVFALIRNNQIDVRAYLTDPDERPLTTSEFSQLWREATGEIPGLESLSFEASFGGPGGGPALSVELSHADIDTLERAATDLAERLTVFSSVTDVDDGYTEGNPQLDFRLREEARSLGLTADEIGRQVRAAFFGAEALRQQIGRNEVRVLVRLPDQQRNSLGDVESLMLRTPSGGGYVPLYQVAEVERGTAYTTIERRSGRRTTTVTADVVPPSETSRILAALRQEILPQMRRDYPGLSHNFRGQQQSMQEAIDSFMISVTITLMAIYILLAVPLRSYAQPIVVMISIPFGVVGAILGHMIMGYNLSIVSIMGVIALGGVVVNGSLVMVHYANSRRREGENAFDAMFAAGVRRFRPIMLTTLTTFGGLAPMIFETSMQARFMIPMALSLGYGILFASAILLLLIPCLYLIIEDIKGGLARGLGLSPQPDRGHGEAGEVPAE